VKNKPKNSWPQDQQTFYNLSNKDRLKNKYSKNSAALENHDISINKYNSKCVPRE